MNGRDYRVTYSNNIKPGTATAVIEGIGAYSGKRELTFTIVPYDISRFNDLIGWPAPYTYTGEEFRPAVRAPSKAPADFLENVGYTVSYQNNKNVGEATVVVKGIGNFTGTSTSTFKIEQADITTCTIDKIPDQTFTGSSISPDLVIKGAKETLKPGIDYKVMYSNNLSVGKATVLVIGEGNYKGYTTAEFSIVKGSSGSTNPGGSSSGGSGSGTVVRKNISAAKIAAVGDQTYTGKALEPELNVTFDGKQLKRGVDYDVAFIDNVEPGAAKAIVAGIGSYEGILVVEFKIVKAESPDSGRPVWPDLDSNAWYMNKVTLGGNETTVIDYVYDNKLITGYDNGFFGPSDTLTRGQVVTILYRAAGMTSSDNNVDSGFSDVPSGEYCSAPVKWAAEKGIVSGYGNGVFGPNDPVTREQLAKMLARSADVAGVSLGSSLDELGSFVDAASVGDWAKPYVAWCARQGILTGSVDGDKRYVNPQAGATRAEAAKMIAVFHSKIYA